MEGKRQGRGTHKLGTTEGGMSWDNERKWAGKRIKDKGKGVERAAGVDLNN